MSFDWNGIAARIRGLVRISDDSDVPSVARRLGVSEVSLRMTVDDRRPLPTVDVIAALVRVYGLDPSWVLTGQYDPATHRTALESDTQEIATAVHMLILGTDAGWRPGKGPPTII